MSRKNTSEGCKEMSKLIYSDKSFISFEINKNELDYSLKSLGYIEEIIKKIKKQVENIDYYNKLILRFGSYLGEVVIQETKFDYKWVTYEDSVKINEEINKYGKSVLTSFLPHSKQKGFLFPMAKVDKYLNSGNQDSLYFYVKALSQID